MYLGPLVFGEVFKAKPWGGRSLARVGGKALPPGEPIGESWELADHPHGTSTVRDGPLTGTTLRELMQEHGTELLGHRTPEKRFPLLIKTIDARERLSVQVHPDDRLGGMGYPSCTTRRSPHFGAEIRKGHPPAAGVRSG